MSPEQAHNPPVYNPLDKRNLAASVADALLAKPLGSFPPSESFSGAGVYAIYYHGRFDAYSPITRGAEKPIYVGKAVPAGSRKGGLELDASSGQPLYKRLLEHAESIRQTDNLALEDFTCRYLVVDDIWIPLAESLLIRTFSPVWNSVIDGFGNHDPGKGRHQGQVPAWDVLHPGRPWAMKLRPNKKSEEELRADVRKHFASLTT